jgi:hypothetical protein
MDPRKMKWYEFGENEELHNLYSSPNIIIMLKSRRTICTDEEERNVCRILVGKLKGKRP